MKPSTKLYFMSDVKNIRVEQPNKLLEACKALLIILAGFIVFFVLTFASEIARAFG